MAEPTLYKSISKKSDMKERASLTRDYDQEKIRNMMVLFPEDTEDKQKTLSNLKKWFSNADASRPDDEWDVAYLQWESEVLHTDDGKANLNLAIEKAVIRNKLADMNSMKTVVKFIPTEDDDIYKVDLNKVVWNFVEAESNLQYYLSKHKRQALVFGASPWWEGLHKEISYRYDPVIGKDGVITGELKKVEQSWIEGRPLDIRNVWFDPTPDWHDAQYVFVLEKGYSYEDIENLKEDPNFDSEAIDRLLAGIIPRNRADTPQGKALFTTREEQKDNTRLKYNLFHFYHKTKGLYLVFDDTFSHIIREGVTPYAHRQLPVTMLVDHRDLYSMYGYGECKLLRSTKYERNEIRNQILDGVRMSNTMNLLVGENISLEGQKMVGGIMNVWDVKGNTNDARFLQAPPMNSGLFSVDTMLQNDSIWLTSIDVNSLVGSPSKTAFEAGLQEQTKLKGIAECVREFDFWFREMARQRLANIQFFMPTTTGKAILGEKNMEKYRKIAIQDKQTKDLFKPKLTGKDAGTMVKKGITFEDAPGKTAIFELTPDMIASSVDVSVETNTTTPILKDIRNHEISEIIMSLLQVAGTPVGQELMKKFDFTKLVEQDIRNKGYDPDEFETAQAEGVDKQSLVQDVMKDMPLPPLAPVEHQPLPERPLTMESMMQPSSGAAPAPSPQPAPSSMPSPISLPTGR